MDKLRVLAVSDVVEPRLYNNDLLSWLPPIDALISCGDLPPYYLDFLVSKIDAPMFHVLGNHCYVAHDPVTKRCSPADYPGLSNLNGRLVEYDGLLMGGLEGSPIYSKGPHQHYDYSIMLTLFKMIPGMVHNKVRVGRYLDILVTHNPPKGIHDDDDVPHRGWAALLPFMRGFKPTFLLHGHTHRYNPLLPLHTRFGSTNVINVYGHAILELVREHSAQAWQLADLSLRG